VLVGSSRARIVHHDPFVNLGLEPWDSCEGTVGSEAGDLSEPAVRRNPHRLKTI